MNKEPFERWEYNHFSHLIILYRKFVEKFENMLFAEGKHINWNSKQIFKVFNRYIYNVSSKKNTKYLEPLTDLEQQLYLQYTNE